MSDFEPIDIRTVRKEIAQDRPEIRKSDSFVTGSRPISVNVSFDRRELQEILNLYGRMVAAGEWRDYAIDFTPNMAVFSVFRRTSELPLYRIEKNPKLARKQGIYSVVTPTGLILKRGHELARVLAAIDKRLKIVT